MLTAAEASGSKFHSIQLLVVYTVDEVSEVKLEVIVEGWRAAGLESSGEWGGSRHCSCKGQLQ